MSAIVIYNRYLVFITSWNFLSDESYTDVLCYVKELTLALALGWRLVARGTNRD